MSAEKQSGLCSFNVPPQTSEICSAGYFVFSGADSIIYGFLIDEPGVQATELIKHRSSIRSLSAVGDQSNQARICSVSPDLISVHDVSRASILAGELPSLVYSNTPTINFGYCCCCLGAFGSIVSVALDSRVFVTDIEGEKPALLAELLVDDGPVVCMEFLSHGLPLKLITITDKRSVKVWNITAGTLEYNSPVIGSGAVLSLAIGEAGPDSFSVGFSDSQAIVYDYLAPGMKQRHRIDLRRAWKQSDGVVEASPAPKFISSAPAWKAPSAQSPQFAQVDETGEAPPILFSESMPAMALYLDMSASRRTAAASASTTLVAAPAESSTRALLGVASPKGCAAFALPSCETEGRVIRSASEVFAASFSSLAEGLAASLLESGKINVYMISRQPDAATDDKVISVVPRYPAPESSCLREHGEKATGRAPQKARTKRSGIANKPVTFHSKVRSSGYGSTPPVMTMFGRKPKPKPKKKLVSDARVYPSNALPPMGEPRWRYPGVSETSSRPVVCCVYSPDGETLAWGSGDGSIRMCRARRKDASVSLFQKHNGPVASLHYAQEQAYLLSAGGDGRAVLWNTGSEVLHGQGSSKSKPLLEVTGVESQGRTKPFTQQVTGQFYYNDRFVALSHTSAIHLLRYKVLRARADDIAGRHINKNKTKVALTWNDVERKITCFSAHNAFKSHLILAGTSNRTVEVFDAAYERVVLKLETGHSRGVHSLAQHKGSKFLVGASADLFNIFATSAFDSSIKIWDLRTTSCAMRLESHATRTQRSGLAFSPCMRYIASGSEDNTALVYDLRKNGSLSDSTWGSGTVLSKLQGHTDTVVDVAFDPLRGDLATSCLDGIVRVFGT